jgi:predicted short-subunit dehydrogenase-like oxidoreductase (DUF2520 family)
MLSVFIIGNGKIAHHLVQAFLKTDVQIAGVYGRDIAKVNPFAAKYQIPAYSDLSKIPAQCDVYFLTVSDQVIKLISEQLKVHGLLVHCSGMMPISVLQNHTHYGSFWPIQSFSENNMVDFKNIPICIEASSEEDIRILEALADRISRKVQIVNQDQRQSLHLAAVLVNNFSNHLFVLAAAFLESKSISFDLLKPLIEETVNKINYMEPRYAQTGPAIRNDIATIDMHKKALAENLPLLHIYDVLSRSIIEHKDNSNE